MKECPLCNCLEGTLSDDGSRVTFGACRSRPDGKNLYCKRCVNMKVQGSRRRLKQYKAAAKARVPLPLFDAPAAVVPLSRLCDLDRIRVAMREGAETLRAIARDAHLTQDAADVCLTRLALAREVTLGSSGERRLYILNEKIEAPAAERKPMQLSQGFSKLPLLMPQRKTG